MHYKSVMQIDYVQVQEKFICQVRVQIGSQKHFNALDPYLSSSPTLQPPVARVSIDFLLLFCLSRKIIFVRLDSDNLKLYCQSFFHFSHQKLSFDVVALLDSLLALKSELNSLYYRNFNYISFVW